MFEEYEQALAACETTDAAITLMKRAAEDPAISKAEYTRLCELLICWFN